MPTYGYRCNDCGVEFERFQKMSDAPVTTCDDCGGSVKKLLYPVGISFKGSGFYVNDYAKSSNGSSRKSSSDNSGSESKTETKSESSSESSTPATSTESKTPATTT
jgi:putative FmdB family regulatory protein